MFSQQPQDIQQVNIKETRSWYQKFSSQPHQPFFSSGIIFFILFLSLFTATYSNIISLDSSLITYHAYSMIFVVFIQFFLGFLYVVFPRFLVQAEIKPDVYMKQFALYLISSLGILFSILFFSKLTIVFQITMLIAQILSFQTLYSIYKKSLVKDKEDTSWVLVGFVSGLVGHLLFIVSSFDFLYAYTINRFSVNIGFYLFLFVIIFAISQRMIPFFTSMKEPSYKINKTHNLMFYIYALLLFKVFVLGLENVKLNLLADIPLLIFITRELVKWKLPLFKVSAIMWVLYLSLYWIPVGLLLSIIESISALVYPELAFEKAVLHIFALGYFVTVLLGFGTRVVLGHSGAVPHADKFAIAIFITVQIITLLRLLSAFSLNFGNSYIFFITLTSILLILGLLIWSSRYLMILFKGK